MTVQRPWMHDPSDQSCAKCRRAIAGRTDRAGAGQSRTCGLGVYDHVHQVTKVPRRRIANRQWTRTTGWAVECSRISAWIFFTDLAAAVTFARVAMHSDDLGTIDLRHAYTETIFAAEPLGPARKFLGLGGPASRQLFNDRLLQTWLEGQITDERDLSRLAS